MESVLSSHFLRFLLATGKRSATHAASSGLTPLEASRIRVSAGQSPRLGAYPAVTSDAARETHKKRVRSIVSDSNDSGSLKRQ